MMLKMAEVYASGMPTICMWSYNIQEIYVLSILLYVVWTIIVKYNCEINTDLKKLTKNPFRVN